MALLSCGAVGDRLTPPCSANPQPFDGADDVTEQRLFSVIVPTRDRPALLNEAIRSVIEQTDSSFELIIVNDGGATPDLPSDPRIRMIQIEQSVGPAGARNVGIAAAKGWGVAFLDDDDLWLPGRRTTCRDALRGRAHVAVCAGGTVGGGPKSIGTWRALFMTTSSIRQHRT